MILFEITGEREDHPAYQKLATSNGVRQYDFLNSAVLAALDVQKPFLSQTVIKALNFHVICCLHVNAGEYRPINVRAGEEGDPNTHYAPANHRVQALMDDFVNEVNRFWSVVDPVWLSAFVLWKLNYIHPFINGNGRTARACSYFVLCLTSGGLLPGFPAVPELITRNRPDYIQGLLHAHRTFREGQVDLSPLYALILRLLNEQVASTKLHGSWTQPLPTAHLPAADLVP